MENSMPLLLLLFFWVVIGIPLSVAKKAANQKKSARPAAQKKVSAEERPAAAPKQPAPERLTTLTPTLYEPDHDDSVYTGSLGPLMSEGYDPCHDEQLSSMETVCQPGRETPAPKEVSALPFGWTGSDIVRGIVMSEILNRKH